MMCSLPPSVQDLRAVSSRRRLTDDTDDDGVAASSGGAASIDFAALLLAILAALAPSMSSVKLDPGAFLGIIYLLLTIAGFWIGGLLMCVYGIRKDIKERRIRELVKRYGNTGQTGSVGAVGVLLEFRDDVSNSLDRSLPTAFRFRPFQQLQYLIMNKHNLFSVFFFYSPNCPR